jgi:acetylornithine/succinyldiaminopimelate/putrescine aminotransferase
MSGSEAVEGAMKLAKRYTRRYEIVCSRNAYHGSTQGAESLRSDIDFVQAFRPLIPGIRFIDFNDEASLDIISSKTACVITEPIQAEAGVQLPNKNFLKALREKCNATGSLLVLDEIQTGFGRTGSLFAFEQYGIEPDILLTAKGLGGGMPIGAFIASKEMMSVFTRKPVLGHITTFGGHPVSCASAHAALNALLNSDLINQVKAKGQLFKDLLKHDKIKEVRGKGLMLAVEMTRKRYMKYVVQGAIENGMLVDWFLFNNGAFRLAPPLIITEAQIREACKKFIDILNNIK